MRINMAAIGSVDDMVELNSAASLFGGGSWYGTAVGLYFCQLVIAHRRGRLAQAPGDMGQGNAPRSALRISLGAILKERTGAVRGDRASEELVVTGRGAEDAGRSSKT